jgi:hypothetical protein
MKKDDGKNYQWHDWFAWYPVQLIDGFVWLQIVERKLELWIEGNDPDDIWEGWVYRKK